MGVPHLERKLSTYEGCVLEVSIAELVKKFGKNIIVVDGFNFYAQYIYPRFNWVLGAFQDLLNVIQNFMEAFEQKGVKLVFFFVDGNLDEGRDRCGSDSWFERHDEFLESTDKIFIELSHQKLFLMHQIEKLRSYYHTPMNVLSVVLFILRHKFQCEVHMVSSGDRNDSIGYYAKNNDCLGILAQDNYYMFYHGVSCYLSLKNLNLKGLTTVQYNSDALARHCNLVGHLYPIFLKEPLSRNHKDFLIQLSTNVNECESVEIAKNKIMQCFKDMNKIEELFGVRYPDDLGIKALATCLIFQMLRFKFGFDYISVEGPLLKWELIKLKAQELCKLGHMNSRIDNIFLRKTYFNENILEDFSTLPPSSLVYQPLRHALYNILFSEEDKNCYAEVLSNDSDNDAEYFPGALGVWERKLYEIDYQPRKYSEGVCECAILKNGCSMKYKLIPEPIDSTLHPGLLKLWDLKNEIPALRDKKWQLFANCFSESLPWELLRSLPSTLVVPVVVLYHLFQNMPQMFKTTSWVFLKSWEVEVFIAQSVMLSRTSAECLSNIVIKNVNLRIVKLIALFVYGCHTVHLLVEACGYPISRNDASLLHFFDGKLFHSFYERAEWRASGAGLCSNNTDAQALFQQMKQIIIPETAVDFKRRN